jgi:hypothetical protein
MRAARTCVTFSLAATAALLAGCAREYGNPFAGSESTAAPSPAADIVFTSNMHAARPGSGREVFAVEDGGANPTRLTFCADEGSSCSSLDVAFGPDRQRAMVRRVVAAANDDGRLDEADGAALFLIDFARSVQGELLPRTAAIESVDWSAISDVVVFAGNGEGGLEDLFRVDPNGDNSRNLTVTPNLRERHPRIDPTGSVAVFERIEGTGPAQIWIFFTTQAQSRVTVGGTPGPALAGTPYVVGSDADPDYSPDGRSIVFRRLTALGTGGRGDWDIVTVSADGANPRTIVSGPAYREAPSWGPGGIVFTERAADGSTSIVVVDPEGANRRVVLTAGPGFELGNARWLP